jgi:hypothetical protein
MALDEPLGEEDMKKILNVPDVRNAKLVKL